MRTLIKHILSLIILIHAMTTWGQSQISGVVTDISGEGLPGVTVQIDGTTDGAITDIDGKYSLVASPSQKLIFSFIGFITQEIEVGSQTLINVVLNVDTEELDEVIVVGYYTQRKEDLSGAIESLEVEDVKQEPYANVLQSLQGKLAGVTIQQDGQPGSGRTSVLIRGVTSYNSRPPLLVIDGIPTEESIDNINPNDIESIQVLKDASSASIYGSRSATGVIVITTKKGKGGKLSVDAGMSSGVQTLANQVSVVNAQEWGQVFWDATFNTIGGYPNIELYGGDVDEPSIVTGTDFPNSDTDQLYRFTRQGTNWADEVYNDGSVNQYYLNITSSTDKGNYGFGLSYYSQDGIVRNTFFDRYTARVNSEYFVNDWITVGENLSVARTNQSQVSSQDTGGGIPYQVIRQHPALPVRDTNGNFAGGNTEVGDLAFPNAINPVAALERNKDNNSIGWRVFGNAYVDVDLLTPLGISEDKHTLKWKTNYGLSYSNFLNRTFNQTFQEGGFANVEATYSNTFGEGITETWINTLEYNFNTENHSVRVLGGSETVAYSFKDLSAGRSNFVVEDPDFVQIGSGVDSTSINGGGQVDWGLRSFFARLDYGFRDKYIASFTYRYDQTSRLFNDGSFPSFSLAWNLHNEDILSGVFNDNGVSAAKLRVSWGQQGSQTISDYGVYAALGPNINMADYSLNGNNETVNRGFITLTRGNPNAIWETTTQTNVGLDIQFLKNFNAVVDIYNKKTEDILDVPREPFTVGEGTPPVRNVGELETNGLDVTLSYAIEKEVSFAADLTVSKFTSKLKFLPSSFPFDSVNNGRYIIRDVARFAENQNAPSFYGLVADGIFQSDEEVDAHADQTGANVGRLRFRDINEDGVINDEDRTFIGSPIPDITLGLNLMASYKGFTLSTLLYASLGQEIYNQTKFNTDFFEPNFNVGRRILDAWTPENTGSSIPQVSTLYPEIERSPSSFYIEDGSFLKMRKVKLEYLVPSSLVKGYSISIYGEVQNVFVITNYSGIDPEVPFATNVAVGGIDRGIYPLPRTFLMGLNIRI